MEKTQTSEPSKETYKEYFCSCGTVICQSQRQQLKDHFISCSIFKEENKDLITIMRTLFKEIDSNFLLQFGIIFEVYMDSALKAGVPSKNKTFSDRQNYANQFKQSRMSFVQQKTFSTMPSAQSQIYNHKIAEQIQESNIKCVNCKNDVDNQICFSSCNCFDVYCKDCLRQIFIEAKLKNLFPTCKKCNMNFSEEDLKQV